MSQQIKDEDISHIEARHVVYCPPPRGTRRDMHLVKEIVHLKNGSTTIRLQPHYDFKRTFYTTKKQWRNHQEKKEWESMDKLDKHTTTQSELQWAVKRAMEFPNFTGQFRQFLRTPYVYGADIKAGTILKRNYMLKYPQNPTPSTVAVFDIETDVNHGTKEIIMATLSFKDRVITAVDKNFLKDHPNAMKELPGMFQEYLGEDVKNRGINWELVLCDGPVGIIRAVFERAHQWKPDFIEIWNINFDMKEVMKALEKAGVDPADIFSDPDIPKHMRFFEYKEGSNFVKTASGKHKPKKWMEQWHTVRCPASFYFVDGACAYKRIRTGAESDEPSYSLEAIMNKHLDRGKMKFKDGSHLSKLEWHKYMQKERPLHYILYNVWDCVGPEILDEATNDLRLTMPMMAGFSDYHDFSSQPRCSADNIHFFLHGKRHIIGTTSDQMVHELDSYCVTTEGWISTLPAANVAANGLYLIKDMPFLQTNIRIHVGDLDVAASYPNGGSVFNMAKDTTVRELHKVGDLDFEIIREAGLNFSGGHTNAVEIATSVFGCPYMDDFLTAFLEDNPEGGSSNAVVPVVSPELDFA